MINIIIIENKFNKLIGSYFFIYSFYHKIVEYNIGQTNFDFIDDGYSSLWLIILYIVGGYLGRFYLYMENKPLMSNFTFFLFIYYLLFLQVNLYFIVSKI